MGLLDDDLNEGAFKDDYPKKRYDDNVDYGFFEAHDVQVIEGKDPWVFFLEHADLEDGRFVWYPTTGSLVREDHKGNRNIGQYHTTEDCYNRIMVEINDNNFSYEQPDI